MKKIRHYHVTTLDGNVESNFFVTASNSKIALANLIRSSSDFADIVNGDNDLTITVKKCNR